MWSDWFQIRTTVFPAGKIKADVSVGTSLNLDGFEVDLYIDNTNFIEVSGVRVGSEQPTALADVSVVMITKANGEEVAGQPWPLSLDPVSGSDGTYRGELSHELELQNGRNYFAQVSIDIDGVKGFIVKRIRARVRT